MRNGIRHIEKPSVLLLEPKGTIPLQGAQLENRELRFDTPMLGLLRHWTPDGKDADHGIKLAGIQVCRAEEPAPKNMQHLFPAIQLMMIRPILHNTSAGETYYVRHVHARGHEENSEGQANLTRHFDASWSSFGSSKWMEPATGLIFGEGPYFEAETKSIQLIALSLLKKTTHIHAGRVCEGKPKELMVPFEYILHRNSPCGAKPDWALYKAQGPI